jgi:hypothetical protein
MASRSGTPMNTTRRPQTSIGSRASVNSNSLRQAQLQHRRLRLLQRLRQGLLQRRDHVRLHTLGCSFLELESATRNRAELFGQAGEILAEEKVRQKSSRVRSRTSGVLRMAKITANAPTTRPQPKAKTSNSQIGKSAN